MDPKHISFKRDWFPKSHGGKGDNNSMSTREIEGDSIHSSQVTWINTPAPPQVLSQHMLSEAGEIQTASEIPTFSQLDSHEVVQIMNPSALDENFQTLQVEQVDPMMAQMSNNNVVDTNQAPNSCKNSEIEELKQLILGLGTRLEGQQSALDNQKRELERLRERRNKRDGDRSQTDPDNSQLIRPSSIRMISSVAPPIKRTRFDPQLTDGEEEMRVMDGEDSFSEEEDTREESEPESNLSTSANLNSNQTFPCQFTLPQMDQPGEWFQNENGVWEFFTEYSDGVENPRDALMTPQEEETDDPLEGSSSSRYTENSVGTVIGQEKFSDLNWVTPVTEKAKKIPFFPLPLTL